VSSSQNAVTFLARGRHFSATRAPAAKGALEISFESAQKSGRAALATFPIFHSLCFLSLLTRRAHLIRI